MGAAVTAVLSAGVAHGLFCPAEERDPIWVPPTPGLRNSRQGLFFASTKIVDSGGQISCGHHPRLDRFADGLRPWKLAQVDLGHQLAGVRGGGRIPPPAPISGA